MDIPIPQELQDPIPPLIGAEAPKKSPAIRSPEHVPGAIPRSTMVPYEVADAASTAASPSSAADLSPVQKQLKQQDLDRAKSAVDKWIKATYYKHEPPH